MEGLIVKKIASLIFLAPSLAWSFSLSGNFKSYPMIKDFPQLNHNQNSLTNSTKIQFNEGISDKIKFEMAYELTMVTEKPLPHSTTPLSYRVNDLNVYIHDEKVNQKYRTSLAQNLNRLNINFNTNFGDILIGRMPIAFGVSKSISPNDVLTPIAIQTIDKEERIGIDTLGFKKTLNSSLLLETGIVSGKNFKDEQNAYYIRPKLTIDKLDFTLCAMKFKEKKLLGFELQHPISEAGFWIDYAYIDKSNSPLKDYSRLTSGIDYKFKNSLYLAFEYHFNGSSLERATVYPEEFLYLRNYHYYILTSSYEINPLLLLSAQAYSNPKDNSFFTTLKTDYNLTDNSYLTLGTYQGIGNKMTSEFGSYGKIFYGSYRFYY